MDSDFLCRASYSLPCGHYRPIFKSRSGWGPRRRYAIRRLVESNRYAAVVTSQGFHCLHGEEIGSDACSDSPETAKEVVGSFHAMDATGDWEPVPISIALGGAGGPADADCIAEITDGIRRGLTDASPVDAVYIFNHGAMTTTEDEGPDGDLYEKVRRLVGPDVPIAATVDLHANVSGRVVDSADVIVSYRTDPHVDQYECGQEAAFILREMLRGLRPVVRYIRVPIVAPNVSLLTESGPYGENQREARPSHLKVISTL